MEAKPVKEHRVPTGIGELDEAFEGGYLASRMYTFYGEEKSGKSLVALQALVNACKQGSRSMLVDCGGMLHYERLKQLVMLNGVDGRSILVFSPSSFSEQSRLIVRLEKYVTPSTSVIALDNFTYLHRLERTGNLGYDIDLYKELAFQMALLKKLALSSNLAVILTSQVYEPLQQDEAVRPVASRIINFWSDVVVKLVNMGDGNLKMATVEKGPGAGLRVLFRIVEEGIEPVGMWGEE